MTNTNYYDFMTVKDLKEILNELPDEMLVVIPVVDEDDVNQIYGFRKVRTAGILRDDYLSEEEREVLCLNSAADGKNIVDQVASRDVEVSKVLYGYFDHGEEENNNEEIS